MTPGEGVIAVPLLIPNDCDAIEVVLMSSMFAGPVALGPTDMVRLTMTTTQARLHADRVHFLAGVAERFWRAERTEETMGIKDWEKAS